MTPNERRLVNEFTREQKHRILQYRHQFDVCGAEVESDRLYRNLLATGTNAATAHQHVEDALRYVVFSLADCALHSQAKNVAMALDIHRMKCDRLLGNRTQYILRLCSCYFTGFTHRPLRLAGFVLAIWLFFVAAYGGISYFSGKPVIRTQDKTDVVWYHYPYFSTVTLATLGYGDFSPDPTHSCAGWVCALVSLEALAGYVFLGLFITLFIQRAGPHPYARLGSWLDQYAHAAVGTESKTLGASILYDPDWPGYTFARSLESTDKHGNSENSSDTG